MGSLPGGKPKRRACSVWGQALDPIYVSRLCSATFQWALCQQGRHWECVHYKLGGKSWWGPGCSDWSFRSVARRLRWCTRFSDTDKISFATLVCSCCHLGTRALLFCNCTWVRLTAVVTYTLENSSVFPAFLYFLGGSLEAMSGVWNGTLQRLPR